jgi:hypothetical protein
MNADGAAILRDLLDRVTADPAPDPRRDPAYFTRRSQHRMYQRRIYGRRKCR